MRDLIQRVAAAALADARNLLERWYPHGRVFGNRFVVGGVGGEKGESLSVHLGDGGWKDYATGATGGDLVSLFAAKEQMGGKGAQFEAAKRMAADLGIAEAPAGRHAPETAAAAPTKPAAAVAEDEWVPLDPAPADAPDYRDQVLSHRTRGDATRHWVYTRNGRPSVIVVRWDYTVDGKPEKDVRPFSCRRHRGTGRMQWRAGSVPAPRPVLNLDAIEAAPSAAVSVVEGEKAADRFTERFAPPGTIVTTSLNGATNAAHSDWSWAKGRRILIWPDAEETADEYAAYLATSPPKPRNRDVSGTRYAQDVERLCRAAGAVNVAWIDRAKLAAAIGVAELPGGFDAADVPSTVPLDLKTLLVEAKVVDLFAGGTDDDEPVVITDGDGADEPAAPGRHHGKQQDLIDSLVGYLKRRGFTPDALDGWRRSTDWALANEDVASLANDFAFDYRHHDDKISQARILETLEAYTRRERRDRRAKLLGTITGQTSTTAGNEALHTWVKAVTGAAGKLDVAVVRHWIWNAKRQALHLRTEHDLMPVLHGGQGSGKTTAAAHLVRPLRELALDMDASYLTDDRRAPVLAAAIIGRWEEMQGSQRADLEALKHMITSPTVSFRPMRTNQTVILPRTCSFIGTSNLPVDVMIQDTTGARRFVELRTPPRCDWDLIATLDPVLVWQSVSENDPCPILDFLHLLRLHQTELVHKDPVSLWLDAEEWGPFQWQRADSASPFVVPSYKHEAGELFEEIAARFGMWCRTVGQSGVGVKSLALRLRQEGFTCDQERRPNGRPRVYRLPSRLLPGAVPPAGTTPDTSGVNGEPPF